MKARILTSIGIVTAIVLMLVLKIFVSAYFFDAFFMVVAVLAALEMSRLLSRMGKYNNLYLIISYPIFVTVATILELYFKLNFGWIVLTNVAMAIVFALAAFLWSLIAKKSTRNEIKVRSLKMTSAKFSFVKALNTLLGLVYPTLLFLCALLLNHVDEISLSKVAIFDGGLSLVVLLFLFLIPMLTDTFAMLCGTLFGGRKLAPNISPNKTISGSLGGTIVCIVVSACIFMLLGSIDYFAPVISNIELWQFVVIVTVGSIVDQCGDLLESFFKRKAGVKDTGKILPGHGGMLDRIDSYILVAPFLLIAMCFLLI